MPDKMFRLWVHNLWVDNCEERVLYCDGNRLTEQEYFQRFKWWLRREYRHQQLQEQQQTTKRLYWEEQLARIARKVSD